MARYLVTGGAGFIGSNLVRFLLNKDQDVVVLDNLSTGKEENLTEVMDSIRFVEGDIRDAQTVRDAMEGCQGVFHLGALGSVPRSVEEPMLSHDVNVNGTLCVLETARELDVKRIVFAASSSAYGNQKASPKHEGMRPLPISPYAANKIACECYMQAYAAAYGMETVCLRYFNVFGPRQDPNGAYAAVIPAWVSHILHNESPVVFGDGEQSRDFCYIDNVCQANWLAANAPAEQCAGEVMNIACSQRTSLNQILEMLNELLGGDVKAVYQDERAGDVKHSLADISHAKKCIGYEPRIFFEEGLKNSIEWYRENLG